MKKKFSRSWNKSKQPRKQRKYRYNAPLNIKIKFMGCHLSKELRGKYKKRSITIRKGDSIKVLRGKFKGKTGKIDRVDIKKSKVYITGIDVAKKDGTKALYPIHPSNLVINELNLEDKKRVKSLERI
ncbi:50S ribosomal protein L24 [Candidatus Woesearchaeota archaeon]|nr:50S ribosomal protein L24 [Candidatus Woesearchaeota archaeon]